MLLPSARNRHEVAPAEATDLAPHAALFVRARDAGLAEERVEAVVRAQRRVMQALAVPPRGSRARHRAAASRLRYTRRP